MIMVLDTNVLVSGILRPFSRPADVLRLVSRGAITVAYDLRILTEYREVLSRPKFGFSRDSVEAFLEQIEEDGLGVAALPLTFRLPDPGDEPFLEVALAAPAEALVTGNKRHYPGKLCPGVKILSPAEFCASLVRPAR
jgi:putative PIN family toxin of toxin-antitoxin system